MLVLIIMLIITILVQLQTGHEDSNEEDKVF